MLSALSQGFSYTHVQKMERSLLFFAQKNQMSDTNGFFFHTFIFNSVFRTEFKKCIEAGQFVCKHPEVGQFFSALVQKKKTHFLFRYFRKRKPIVSFRSEIVVRTEKFF